MARLLLGVMLKLPLNLLFLSWLGTLPCVRLTSIELPLHELVERAVRVVRQLLVCPLFRNLPICADANNAI